MSGSCHEINLFLSQLMEKSLCFALAMLLFLSSCTIVDCTDPTIRVQLKGFSKQELQTVERIRYEKGTLNPIDTVISGYDTDTFNYYDVYLSDYTHYDFSIRVINTNNTYSLTSFRVKKRKYNCGFMSMATLCSNPVYYQLNSVDKECNSYDYCEYNTCPTIIEVQK